MRKFFYELKDSRIIYCLGADTETGELEIVDINDPMLKKQYIKDTLIAQEYSFNIDHPTRSQILYRKGFYKTEDFEVNRMLRALRDRAA